MGLEFFSSYGRGRPSFSNFKNSMPLAAEGGLSSQNIEHFEKYVLGEKIFLFKKILNYLAWQLQGVNILNA